MLRNTGAHPFNSEPPLKPLQEAAGQGALPVWEKRGKPTFDMNGPLASRPLRGSILLPANGKEFLGPYIIYTGGGHEREMKK